MSSYIGRYHRVRPLGPHGWGAPYVFDRGRAQQGPRLIPAPYDKGETFKGFTRYGEWWRSPGGLWSPIHQGGSGPSAPRTVLPRVIQSTSLTATQTTLGLDSIYLNGVSGDAIANRLVPNDNATVSLVYFFIVSYTGTAANVNDINLELRNNSFTTGPSTTLHDSQTKDPASATGWIESTGWTFVVTGGTPYWLVVGDADGGIVDFATLSRHTSLWGFVSHAADSISVQTTDGWASVRTFNVNPSMVVVVFTNGRTLGDPFSAVAASTSSTNQRGLRFIAPATVKLYGSVRHNAIAAATITGINLWADSNGPGGSADANGTAPLLANQVGNVPFGFAFGTPPTVTQGQSYRLVYAYGAASTTPSRLQIGTGSTASLRAAMAGGGDWYWTEANGTTDWSNDNTSEFPGMDVLVEDFLETLLTPTRNLLGVGI